LPGKTSAPVGRTGAERVKDLAHSVAHSDRDRGYAYDYIKRFIAHLVQIIDNGGLLVVKPVFSKDELIPELAADLRDIGFNITEADVKQNYAVNVFHPDLGSLGTS
jgi:hypothetical protein